MAINPRAVPLSTEADPSRTGGRRVGVLLSHGFTGSPHSMRPWAEHLAAQGYAVELPRLPGHGTTWQEMNRTGWSDWYGCLESSLQRLAERADVVFVAGLSMGGGLVLQLAARHPQLVSGVLLVNPAVASTNRQLLVVPALRYLVRGIPGIGNDIKKEGVDEGSYARTPLHALHEMLQGWRRVREDLPAVTAPVLLFRSREDHVVDPSSGRLIAEKVSSRDVTEVILEDSYHVATLDNDAPLIEQQSVEFIQRLTS